MKHALSAEPNNRKQFDILLNISRLFDRNYQSDSTKHYLRALLNKSLELSNDSLIFISYLQLGKAFSNEGDYYQTLNYSLKAAEKAESINDPRFLANVFNNISWYYVQMGDYRKGIDNSLRSIHFSGKYERNVVYTFACNNTSIGYMGLNMPDSALFYNRRANDFNEKAYEDIAQMWILAEFVEIYQNLHLLDSAKHYYQKCIVLFDKSKSSSYGLDQGVVFASTHYSRLLNYFKQYDEAKRIATDAYNLGTHIDYKRYLIDLARELSKSHEGLGHLDSAYQFARMENDLKDSVFNQQQSAQIQNMLLDEAIRSQESKHKLELAKKNRNRNILVGFGLLALLLTLAMYSRIKFVRKSNKQISQEKERSETLLLNILPAEIAEELKEKGSAEARDFELISILFTDFKEFTQASEKLSAKELVSEIHTCFKAFDGILEKYGVEKIKTIGDAYMAAGGLPVPSNNSVKNTILASLEMQQFIVSRKIAKDARGETSFEMRVGIHTGPVVAGIVGVKKFQYDIWGDTVNTASRMESAGAVGKVNISQATYQLLKNDSEFSFESRGKIEVKGKGEMEMFFVDRSS